MAPQRHGRLRKHDDEPPWLPEDDEEEEDSPLSDSDSESTVSGTVVSIPMATTTPTEITDYASKGWRPPYTNYPGDPSTVAWPGWPREGSSTATWTTSTHTPYGDSLKASTSSITPALVASNDNSSPSATVTDGSRGQRPDWAGPKGQADDAPMYAAASVVPIVVLAIIGGIAFYCLRKRRRQRERAGARMTAQEMKVQPQVTARPYIAPPTVSPQYAVSPSQPPPTSDPSAPPPVILGPIPSGANGAYLTGIDTSDVVSVTSNNVRPADPFADNNSLAEPPPPYRPRSIAPPSFVSASRQSSFRTPQPLAATSQTHLIERSPFEDPQDDDAVSEMSGPTLGRDDDAVSAVSDLSYQQDPVVGRSSLA